MLFNFPFLILFDPLLRSYSAFEKQILKFPFLNYNVCLQFFAFNMKAESFVNIRGIFESFIRAFFTPPILIRVLFSHFFMKRIMRNEQTASIII